MQTKSYLLNRCCNVMLTNLEDRLLASYILKQTLNQFGAKTEVTPIEPVLDKLNKEALAIVNRNSQRAEGEGFWFRAKDAEGNIVGTYYVETDPVAIYLRDGAYLGWLEGEPLE